MSADLTYTAGFSISRNFATFPSFWHSELKSSKAFGINLGGSRERFKSEYQGHRLTVILPQAADSQGEVENQY